jgi:hypothetical protein
MARLLTELSPFFVTDIARLIAGYLNAYENALATIIATDRDVQTFIDHNEDGSRSIWHAHLALDTRDTHAYVSITDYDGHPSYKTVIDDPVREIDPDVYGFSQKVTNITCLSKYFHRLNSIAVDLMNDVTVEECLY